jgi:hypothetical protein
MDNQYYIEKYKDIDEIIKTYYKLDNIPITGLINPIKIDNRNIASVPDNQGSTPHCSGYSIANMFELIYWKRTGKLINLNADQIYAKAKELDCKPSINGVALEFAMFAAAELCGIKNKLKLGILRYSNPDETIEKIKFLIHKYDVVQAGFMISTGWNKVDKNNYIIERTSIPLGCHAVLIVGYDPIGIYIQNSWGKGWGFKSFAIMKWEDVIKDLTYCCYIDNLYGLDFTNI